MIWLTIVLGAAASLGGTWLTRMWARHALLDHPNARSSHSIPTPRGGGLGILAGLGVFAAMEPSLREVRVGALLVAIAALSFADDLRPLGSRLRLIAHLAVAAVAVGTLGGFVNIVVPPLGGMSQPAVVAGLSLLWIVGLTNAYNFMDGIDGIAAVQAIAAGLAWAAIGALHDVPIAVRGGLALAAAAAGFLPFNWPRASIFMGDVGSATLGLAFALLPILASRQSGAEWAAAAGVLVVWPFVFDACFTVVRRARRGERLLESHRSHLYQRLVIAGWSHRAATALYGGLAGVCGIAAVAVASGQWWWGWVAAGATAAALLALTNRAEGILRGRASA